MGRIGRGRRERRCGTRDNACIGLWKRPRGVIPRTRRSGTISAKRATTLASDPAGPPRNGRFARRWIGRSRSILGLHPRSCLTRSNARFDRKTSRQRSGIPGRISPSAEQPTSSQSSRTSKTNWRPTARLLVKETAFWRRCRASSCSTLGSRCPVGPTRPRLTFQWLAASLSRVGFPLPEATRVLRQCSSRTRSVTAGISARLSWRVAARGHRGWWSRPPSWGRSAPIRPDPSSRGGCGTARIGLAGMIHLWLCRGGPRGRTHSLCPFCDDQRLISAQLLEARGREREAASMLDREIGRSPPSFWEPVWALERARVNERLGNRAKALAGYSFVAAVWIHADPELQPYVAEARAGLKRLGGEPR